MKNKISITAGIIGFVVGIVFYGFNLMISNAEVSSVDPEMNELLRNINYPICILYGLVGAAVFYGFTLIFKNIKTR